MTLAYVLIGVILLGELPSLGRRRPGSLGADRGSYALVTLSMAAGYWSAFYAAATTAKTFGPWSAPAGAVLTVGGTLFRFWAIRTLGRYFTRSVRVSADQPVIDNGPYRWVRHPSYTGGALAALGVGLALGNAVGVACLLAACAVGFGYRIHIEEKALVETLGEPYRAYRLRTKRLIPFIW